MKPLAILLLLGAAAGADDLLPQSFPKDRYVKTIAKSPFILETKAAEPEAPKVILFKISTCAASARRTARTTCSSRA